MKPLLLTLFILFLCNVLVAQDSLRAVATIKGQMVAETSQVPLANITIRMPRLKILGTTDRRGLFSIDQVPYGKQLLIIGDGYGLDDSLNIFVNEGVMDLGRLPISIKESNNLPLGPMPSIVLDGDMPYIADNGSNDQHISGILAVAHDPYLSATIFSLAPLGYQPRGYTTNQTEIYLNGLQMNDIETGSAYASQWSGLNDVFREQTFSFGLKDVGDAFGGLAGSVDRRVTAADQPEHTGISYTMANRNYRNRFMLTHNTGLLQNGWAISIAASKRWAKEGYVEGTFYDAYAYYLGISKKVGRSGLCHFITFGAPMQAGMAAASTEETMELTGSHFYNPNWGYQNGGKRNAKISNTYLPVYMFNYEHNPNNNTHLNIAATYGYGYTGISGMDWYNADDPRPDYYKKLPSNYILDENIANPGTADLVRQEWLQNPQTRQINWNELYDANRVHWDRVNGVEGRRSVYMIGEDKNDMRKYSVAVNFQKAMGANVSVSTGMSYAVQQMESYRKMLDLLGGDFYVNLNQFAERTYGVNSNLNQINLNHPSQIIRVGDKYAYDYKTKYLKGNWWAQASCAYNKVDFFLATRLGFNAFSREGLYKNALFPDDSYGKAKTQRFFTYQVKGGLTYKINGRHYLFAHAALFNNAPLFDNIYISPRTRNNTIGNPGTEQLRSIEGGYVLRTPHIQGRLTGFVSDINDANSILRFYHEDYRGFVNYAMSNVSIRHIGAELAVQLKVSTNLSVTAVMTWMQVFYKTNPNISIYKDNDTIQINTTGIAYLKNVAVAAGPQSAYAFGFNYRSKGRWYAGANFNIIARNYIAVNPSRRTIEAIDLVPVGSNEWHAIVDQEQLPAAFSADIFAGKSFLLSKKMKWLPRNTFFVINTGVNNILNNKNMAAKAYEQLRFDFDNKNPERFPNKYIYNYGVTYFVSLGLKF